MILTTLCYIERDGKYLMLHRTKKENDINVGKWIAPGGHVEENETPTECVIREVREETGLILHSAKCRGIVRFISPNESEEMFVFSSDDFSGELTECDEGDLQWILRDEIFDLPMWEGDERFLRPLINDDRFIRITLQYDEKGNLLNEDDPILIETDGAVGRLNEYLDLEYKNALIVTGKHSASSSGALSDVERELNLAGIDYKIFSDVEENPSVDTVMSARDVGIATEADIVIGIGGGSPMDAAKAAALMVANRDCGAEFLYDKREARESLPVICIPTTCGTGSEATGVSVLSRPTLRKKGSIPHKIMPSLGLMDAAYLKAAPIRIVHNTAIDAFAHLCESYINARATEYSRAVAGEGLIIWSGVKDELLADSAISDNALKELLCASTIAGIAISETGTSLPHALSYTLTSELNIPHGLAVGYFLPGYIKQAGANGERVLSLGGFSSVEEFGHFYERVCEVPIVPEDIISMAAESVVNNPEKLALCPFEVDDKMLRDMALAKNKIMI